MSVIVAIKDGDKILIGADSQVTGGGGKSTLTNKNNFKIFKPTKDNKFIVGVVGNIRDANLLSTMDEYIDELTILKNEVNFKYIVTKLVPKIFSVLENNKRLSKTNDLYNTMYSNVVIVYDDKMYCIESNGGVIEYDDYLCVGSGEELALGYLNSAKGNNKKELLIDSIKSSCKSNLYVNFPIVIMNTADDKVEIIDK